ncbi:MAG TPA: hypothetical protein VGW38_04725 [Chloroflexota bacterium]|nr:hypothetical protein [Chloroflexota bacterium]
MAKKALSLEEIEAQTALELPDRHMMAVAVGAGGLIGIGVAVDRVDVIDDVTVENNTICVNVAAINSQAGC